jgi:hypothetical protein
MRLPEGRGTSLGSRSQVCARPRTQLRRARVWPRWSWPDRLPRLRSAVDSAQVVRLEQVQLPTADLKPGARKLSTFRSGDRLESEYISIEDESRVGVVDYERNMMDSCSSYAIVHLTPWTQRTRISTCALILLRQRRIVPTSRGRAAQNDALTGPRPDAGRSLATRHGLTDSVVEDAPGFGA